MKKKQNPNAASHTLGTPPEQKTPPAQIQQTNGPELAKTDLMAQIAERIRRIKWRYEGQARQPFFEGLPDWDAEDFSGWPMIKQLRHLLDPKQVESKKDTERMEIERVRHHIWGVVASMNEVIGEDLKLKKSNDQALDHHVEGALGAVRDFCLYETSRDHRTAVPNRKALDDAQRFLLVAALYHDIGKTIGNDRHVSRGVHLMRDVNDKDRKAFEEDLMGGLFEDKHNFWTLLSHHDTFGVLCTGEASLPALSEMVSWSGDLDDDKPHKSPAALLSYLVLLNIADMDSSLFFLPTGPKGIRTIEANRYLEDWKTIKRILWNDREPNWRPNDISREDFRETLLNSASHPKRTIERIARIITTSYRMVVAGDLIEDESEVKTLVENELGMLHGARLQKFCGLFAQFCKIDYGRRFFDVLMQVIALREDFVKVSPDRPPDRKLSEPPGRGEQLVLVSSPVDANIRSSCLRQMTQCTCSILKRFVDDYGNSVDEDSHSAPLMCIVMANLMPDNKADTAWAIARALLSHESRALAWISEEVAVSPYGG